MQNHINGVPELDKTRDQNPMIVKRPGMTSLQPEWGVWEENVT